MILKLKVCHKHPRYRFVLIFLSHDMHVVVLMSNLVKAIMFRDCKVTK